jgi:hypothetical protein
MRGWLPQLIMAEHSQLRVLGFQVGCRSLEKNRQESGRSISADDHHERRHTSHHPFIPSRQRGADLEYDPANERNVSASSDASIEKIEANSHTVGESWSKCGRSPK